MSTWTTILALLLLLSNEASGNVEDFLGLGSRATALGGAFGAVADDVSAIHYNPGGIAMGEPHLIPRDRGHGIGLMLGFVYAQPRLWLRYGALQDDAVSYGDRTRWDTLATTGFTAAVSLDLGQLLGVRGLSLGLAAYFPVKRYAYWEIKKSALVQWPMYDDRCQHVTILPAVAYRIHRTLSIGLGLRIFIDVQTITVARVVAVQEESESESASPAYDVITENGEEVTIATKVAPVAGVLFKPWSFLSFGFTYRAEIVVDDHGHNDIVDLPTFGTISYKHRFAHYFSPHEVVLSIAGRPHDRVLVAVDVAWQQWSRYLDTYHRRFQSDRLEEEEPDSRFPPVFSDVWLPRVGMAVRATSWLEVLVGYFYAKSPVDNRRGWTNFVDCDRHVGSIGTDLDISRLLGLRLIGLTWSWHFQLHWLRERRFTKDWHMFSSDEVMEANPGYPGYIAGGMVFNVGTTFSIRL